MSDMRDFISLIATLTSWEASVCPERVIPVLVAAIVELELFVTTELPSWALERARLVGSKGKSVS